MEIMHVLVPLDGSQLAEKALFYAAHVVSPQGVITLLMVLEHPGQRSQQVPPPVGFSGVIGEDAIPNYEDT